MSRLASLAFQASLLLALAPSVQAQGYRVLVTNDDGVGAPGIDVLVEELRLNPELDITVIAPATNQSGSGDNFTNGPVSLSSTTTASGFPATAVNGFPADSVLLGVLELLAAPPDVIVSGINSGQNISDFIAGELSGTVGAALTGTRLGVRSIAVSQGLFPSDFSAAARYTANVVERLRRSRTFRKHMLGTNGLGLAKALNINFPTCNTGSVRGVAVVPLGALRTVTGYTQVGTSPPTFDPTVVTANVFASNCSSLLTEPSSDVEAMQNGFASVTPLNPDFTVDGSLRRFGFLSRLPFN